MSWKALFIVVAFAIVGWPRASHAEKVKANQPTKLYSRAGEQAPVLLKLKEGQSMTVLAKDGRWIKVRVSGRTGWVPRSKVDLPEGDEIVRNTRRRPFVDGRGTKRGFGGEGGPDDRVGADATGEGAAEPEPRPAAKESAEDEAEDEKPAKKPARAAKAEKPEKAEKPAAKHDKKKPEKAAKPDDDEDVVSVDDDEPAAKKPAAKDDGEAKPGKEDEPAAKEPALPKAHVAKPTVAYSEPNAQSEEMFTAQPKVALTVHEAKGKWTYVENDEGDSGYVLTSKLDVEDAAAEDSGPRRRSIDLRGRVGLSRIGHSVSTPGGATTPPDNYNSGGASVTLSLGAQALYPYKARYWVGGEFNYDLDKAIAGVTYKDESTGITYHNFNLRAEGGYDLQNAKAMVVFARLGLHYESYQVADVANLATNTATLPSQNITGPTLGVALAIGKLTPKVALRLSLDAMLLSSVTQTKNLEDGTGGSAKAVYLGGQLNYHWKQSLDLQGNLDLGYTSLSFSGPPPATSQRMHTGTGNVSSSDLATTLTVGVAYRL